MALEISKISMNVLRYPERDCVVRLFITYKLYKGQVTELNHGLVEHKRMTPVIYKACVAVEFLLSLTELVEFTGTTKIEDVTDLIMRSWADRQFARSTNYAQRGFEGVLGRVSFSIEQEDPGDTVLTFFMDSKIDAQNATASFAFGVNLGIQVLY